MKSEFREFEVFITRDGEVFMDDSAAGEHERYLDAKDMFLGLRASIIRLNQDAQVMLHAVDLIFKGCSANDLPYYEPGCKMHRLIMWGFVDEIEDRFGKNSEVAEQARQCNTIEEAITLVEVLKL